MQLMGMDLSGMFRRDPEFILRNEITGEQVGESTDNLLILIEEIHELILDDPDGTYMITTECGSPDCDEPHPVLLARKSVVYINSETEPQSMRRTHKANGTIGALVRGKHKAMQTEEVTEESKQESEDEFLELQIDSGE